MTYEVDSYAIHFVSRVAQHSSALSLCWRHLPDGIRPGPTPTRG